MCASSATAAATSAERAQSCEAATQKLKKAQAKLKRLQQHGAPAKAIRKAKQKAEDAQFRADDACPVIYAITGADGTFDATEKKPPDPDNVARAGCSPLVREAHWTSTLAPNPKPASLEVYTRDRQGDPIYILTSPLAPLYTPLVTHGSGFATQTCSHPLYADGTSTCDFNYDAPFDTLSVGSDPSLSRDPLTIAWYWGYNIFSYGDPRFGGSCVDTGRSPPSVAGEHSPGLFVSTINGHSDDPLEPLGITTAPVSSFGANATLTFSGSASTSNPDGSTLDASWQMTYSLARQ